MPLLPVATHTKLKYGSHPIVRVGYTYYSLMSSHKTTVNAEKRLFHLCENFVSGTYRLARMSRNILLLHRLPEGVQEDIRKIPIQRR